MKLEQRFLCAAAIGVAIFASGCRPADNSPVVLPLSPKCQGYDLTNPKIKQAALLITEKTRNLEFSQAGNPEEAKNLERLRFQSANLRGDLKDDPQTLIQRQHDAILGTAVILHPEEVNDVAPYSFAILQALKLTDGELNGLSIEAAGRVLLAIDEAAYKIHLANCRTRWA